jgi:hypothetical protein
VPSLASAEAVSFGLIVTELVINTIKHAFVDDRAAGLIVVWKRRIIENDPHRQTCGHYVTDRRARGRRESSRAMGAVPMGLLRSRRHARVGLVTPLRDGVIIDTQITALRRHSRMLVAIGEPTASPQPASVVGAPSTDAPRGTSPPELITGS